MMSYGDRHTFQRPETELRGAGICGGTIQISIALKNHVITIIITYPPNLENLFIICLKLGYNIGPQ